MSFSLLGGRWGDVEVIVQWLESTGLHALTISGGEPFDQAPALIELIERLRARGEWLITCFTGHRIETLRRDRIPGAAELVESVDLLIDGPYIEERHASLLWRGSDNQRIHDISGRVTVPDDASVGISVVVDTDGGLRIVGVPPEPGFIDEFTEGMAAGGIEPSPIPSVMPFHTMPYRIDQEA